MEHKRKKVLMQTVCFCCIHDNKKNCKSLHLGEGPMGPPALFTTHMWKYIWTFQSGLRDEEFM